jgi:hypothetical protein
MRNLLLFIALFLLAFSSSVAQVFDKQVGITHLVKEACPLDRLTIIGAQGQAMVSVTDGKGKEYVRSTSKSELSFVVSGALGTHTVSFLDNKGDKIQTFTFEVNAKTSIDDGGYYKEMFEMFHKGMYSEIGSIIWNGKKYNYFVPWGLDHCHTMKGLKYFDGVGHEFVDLMREVQREDGMIYSFVQYMENADYFYTRDKWSGYTRKIGDKYFVRQPTENHPEYIFVNTVYQCWKSSGDTEWLKNTLPAAIKSLDYIYKDPARFSKRFQLLKRVYTIDSWDFAVEDEYMPNLGITNSMIIHPDKSKFGVFFGDNTGYIAACYEVAEMLEYIGQVDEAQKFRERGEIFKERLDKLAWNGKFYTHFIDEDAAVKRNLGVNERTQIAQSNAYSLNRPLNPPQSKAIIETYLNLKNNLPQGSPAEWYAIYPPFERGFDTHGAKWQYMNGGVGGHVAGELSRGAFESGYEKYGADILNRLFELGKKYDNKIYFAYTGAMSPPPPPATYKQLNINFWANMDTWVNEKQEGNSWMLGKRVGDDLRELPVGEQTFANIKFNLIDPAKNNRKSVVAVGKENALPQSVEIPVNETAACLYFLHTSSKPSSENIVGGVSFVYEDNSKKYNYIVMEKHLTYWWFSQLKNDYAGIAWYGKNLVSEGVGLSWCAINNPEPTKKIAKIILHAPENKGIYTVLGITLADKPHYLPVKMPSFGGPDNWAAATAMAALIEGLAGVKDAPKTAAYHETILSPRWNETSSDSVRVTVCYPASKGYLSYLYQHQKAQKKLHLHIAGSSAKINCHLLLPQGISKPQTVLLNGKPQSFTISQKEQSVYVDFVLNDKEAKMIEIMY